MHATYDTGWVGVLQQSGTRLKLSYDHGRKGEDEDEDESGGDYSRPGESLAGSTSWLGYYACKSSFETLATFLVI